MLGQAYVDAESRFVTCEGVEVHYKVAGPPLSDTPTDAAVLMLHGFGGGTFSWRLVANAVGDAKSSLGDLAG